MNRPGRAARSRFTRSSKRPHGFAVTSGAGIEVHHDFGKLDAPDELHFDVKGLRNKTRRLEAYWNGCVFVRAGRSVSRGGPPVLTGGQDRIRSPFGSHSGSSATTAGTRSPNTSTSNAVPGTARSTGRYANAMEEPTA